MVPLGTGLVMLLVTACAAPELRPEVVVSEPESKAEIPVSPPLVYASFRKGHFV